MACGIAVKRSLELDPHHSPDTAKRPRPACSPMRLSPHCSSSPFGQAPSPFSDVVPAVTSEQIDAYLKAEIRRLRRQRLLPSRFQPYAQPSGPQMSPGGTGLLQYNPDSSPGRASSGSESDGEGCRMMESSFAPSGAHGYNAQHHGGSIHTDPPMFTRKQVQLICERLLREQEAKLRGEYEQVLSAKLAEQYETFVRFTQDQIHRKYTHANASYLS